MSDALRCPWCGSDPLYVAYHDTEWGRPERDPRALWESLILECFQAGLSWITILRRREGFRAAFEGFDPAVIAGWGEAEVTRLLADPGIIRHRGKIEGTIRAAGAYLRIEEREGFANFIWRHAPPPRPRPRAMGDVPAQTEASVALSKALKKEGFSFCGPVIVYAFMQASGLVNDHLESCPHG
ncbi:DNA-3-methyladenine glycosylase I [Tabrizicola fusiformis]|uniref:DNA-3-methyladenine glycosylase I n=1 Tax=Tabrizicola sp. SY72 TaxID=2741673 RepID=UPI00157489B4|nr:DNA-3-methyladenine glycosylase I [Tabrizicola sp. SY72]NTT84666.1 DNA-3-methyladenine glycosylase I [Tabrizicola sp. SY72]